MKTFKNYPICEKHGTTYDLKRGCYACRKEMCQCVGTKRIVHNGICINCHKRVGMKRLDEALDELEHQGKIPKKKAKE